MCGIAGILRFDEQPVDRAELQAMVDALAHRGPDGEGVLIDGNFGLGHRRLAIIDLAGSPQPMRSSDGRYAITYNGELYNYRELRAELMQAGAEFRTQGDTEVILAAWAHWGTNCVKHFRGMFAFCVVDLQTREYFLARDHFGIKPLYYVLNHSFLAFASEINALRRIPEVGTGADLAMVEEFLRYQYIPGEQTLFDDILSLEPACFLHGHEEAGLEPEPERYWTLEFEPQQNMTPRAWLDRADAVIEDSVRAHLVADVPVGAFVSGGIDSSLVAWKVNQLGAGPQFAFSMGFEDAEFSELPHARMVAEKLGIELRTGTAAEDFWQELPRLVAHFGQPFGDASMIPMWQVAGLARRDVIVVLSGDAGDEAFGGYSSYAAFNAMPRLREYWRRLRRNFSGRELGALCWALGRKLGGHKPRRSEWERTIEYVGRERRLKLWQHQHRWMVDRQSWGFSDSGAPRHELTAYAQDMDFRTYLPGCVLTKVDMATMFHGLESRTPLLDIEVVNFARTLPENMRMRREEDRLVGKAILKDLLARLMGPDFVHRKKQGFGIPRQQWFLPGRKGRAMFEAVMADPASGLGDWFNMEAIGQAAIEHGPGRDRSGMMWLLLVLGLWRQQNPGVSF